ncbi:MAG: hypothetical protein AAGD07_11525 [Planctomycetota bacterium]
MFFQRRSSRDPAIDWPALLSLLEDEDRRAAVQQVAPGEALESFLAALRRIKPALASETLAAGQRYHTAERLAQWPTLAVAGMLNSGKTSLVSSFLSPRGRERALRGTANDEGTHRFVIWLPEDWRSDIELWSLLITRIGDALGEAPEDLAEDPMESAGQYNNRDADASRLRVPLVATDPALNDLGVGLIDCPDIVSDEELGLGSPEDRRELLGRAATLCSGFLIVTDSGSARDSTLADLLRIASDLMPGVTRFLAVNKVRRQTPEQVHATFEQLAARFNVAGVYAAYDYDIPANKGFIPTTDQDPIVDLPAVELADEPLPVFFETSADDADNPPNPIASERLLAMLPSRLDRAELFLQLQKALRLSVETRVWHEGLATIRENAETSRQKTDRAHHTLLDASLEFFAQRSQGKVTELRLHQSERIVRQLSESFAATAPRYARWSIRVNATLRRFLGGAGDLIRSLTPTALSQKAADEIKGRFRSGDYGGLIDPESLVREILRHGGESSLSHHYADDGLSQGHKPSKAPVADALESPDASDQPFTESIRQAVMRFEQNDFTTLDPRRLDEVTARMWKQVPIHRKLVHGLTPLATVLATFGAAFTVPIDFGASWLFAASMTELFAAAGLSAFATLWAGNQGSREIAQHAARQQLSDFLAVLCDALGLARAEGSLQVTVDGKKVVVPTSQLETILSAGPTITLLQVRNEFLSELNKTLPRQD